MRIQFYDILKGYAIFLVVLGHIIQAFLPGCETNGLYLFIYSFHMPLFIAISGYFFLKSVDKVNTITFIKNKFQHLMLPSLSIGAIDCLIYGGGKLLKHSDLDLLYMTGRLFTGLWFLTVLFVLSVIGCLFKKYLNSKMYVGWFLFLVTIYFCPDFWIINELKYLIPFFVASIAFSKFRWNTIPNWLILLSIGCYIVMFHHYNFSLSMYRMSDNVFTLDYLYGTFFRSMIGLLGCLVSIALCKYIAQVPYVCKYLLYLGGLTLPIYVLHQKLFMWNMVLHIKFPNMLVVIMGSLIIIQLSIFLYKILKRNRICAFILFGERCAKSH